MCHPVYTEEELRDCGGVPVPARAAAGDRGRVLPGLADCADRQLAAHAHGQGRLARHVDHALKRTQRAIRVARKGQSSELPKKELY